jgi:hypothetical protein
MDQNSNLFSYFALIIWPVVVLCLFLRLSVGRATLWGILGGYLLLPVHTQIKFSGIPDFGKGSIPSLAILICCLFFARRGLKFVFGFGVTEILLLVLIFSPFITSSLNTDPIVTESQTLPGVGPYDALSAVVGQLIFMLPFFIGRQFLRTSQDNEEIMRVLVIAGLAYSLPMLFEIRMSPQLNTWIYGFFPSSFGQAMRDGGFRPVVFLGNGLLVAFFAMTTAVAAAALWRTRIHIGRLSPAGITGYLSFVLVLCKTVSAIVYGVMLIPLVRWASPRRQLRVASVFVIIALAYPMLRTVDLVPTTSVIELARAVDVRRAQSLGFRFDQESQLLGHAWERIWFGWGRFGRNRVYHGWQGRDSSVTDGYWIIILGTFGLVGFLAVFGLLAFTVLRAAMALRFAQTTRDSELLAALALIVAINMIDLLPNASISPWTWLLAGALLGRADALFATAREWKPMTNFNLPLIRAHKPLHLPSWHDQTKF